MNVPAGTVGAVKKLLLASWLTILSVSICEAQEPQTPARSEAIPLSYFGLHIHDPLKTPWPNVQFGALRLWDTNTRWRELEPSPGHFDFSRLDALIEVAQQHRVHVLLGLGLPPQWASQRPNEGPKHRPGSAAPPKDMQLWRNYVKAVVTHCKGRITGYEIWNEVNNPDFYSGDRRTLLELTKEASAIIRKEDSNAQVVSPNFTGKNTALKWLDNFLEDGGGDYVDAIGYHFYVFPDTPEAIVPLGKRVGEILARHHIDKPVWDTETNWLQKNTVPNGQQAAYVLRAFVLGWAANVERFYWYAWDEHSNISIEFTDKDNRTETSAVNGWRRAAEWLLGQYSGKCETYSGGTWVCHVAGSAGDSFIAWNTSGEGKYSPPGGSKWTVTTMNGKTSTVSGNSISVGPDPVRITRAQ